MNESSIAVERTTEVDEKMDDNENYIECTKMNFSQFNSFAGPLAANQFASAKFPQNLSTAAANGQVVGLVSGSEGAMQFLRPMDGTAVSTASAVFQQHPASHGQIVTTAGLPQGAIASPAYITLPITMPGAKPGDAQQTVQIQVLNPNPLPSQMTPGGGTGGGQGQGSGALQTPKFQMGQMQIPIQGFQQGTTVLTVAYSPQDEEVLHNQGLPEGMTIVAALQPQDLQLLASQNPGTTTILQQHQQAQANLSGNERKVDSENPPPLRQIKQEAPALWNHQSAFNHNQNTSNASAIMNGVHHPHLVLPSGIAIGPGIIKQEIITDDHSNENTQFGAADSSGQIENGGSPGRGGREDGENGGNEATGTNNGGGTEANVNGGVGGKARKKRKYKTKPPKPKRQKPGQVHITTAIDGTVLFCCPECHMAYPEKECLEQHLVVHKIERRFICDICGAGLKRKEHLERHKLGHNPERPFICNVCKKGFKRKEHLNLHFVIHSGVKTEICNDCGKGFYRKDHLRKHIKSHLTKRLKEEKASNRTSNNNNNSNSSNRNASNGTADTTVNGTSSSTTGSTTATSLPAGIPPGLTITTSSASLQAGGVDSASAAVHQTMQNLLQSAISLPQGVTIHVPTADNQTLPVQISLSPMVTQQPTEPDGSTRTVLVPASPENLQHLQNHPSQQASSQQQSSNNPGSSPSTGL
ncbi:AGAP001269-PA-like protein [Anopheles sinensis]|uniref:AGAP001269-PA-like protein n=1 Tax=Anopheles sinensis TaxID=74873 RepID=A0A084W0L4_ANOSI|nr:AGAP001269-PA-like protein [Anopheles sinensis]